MPSYRAGQTSGNSKPSCSTADALHVGNSSDGSAPPVVLSTRLQSFHRWLCKLSAQNGYCWASTDYLAKTQRATPRTVYRWLAKLRAGQFISCDVDCGIERRITPLRKPEPIRGTPHRFIQTHKQISQNVRGKQGELVRGDVRGLPYDAYTQETTTLQTCHTARKSADTPIANNAPYQQKHKHEKNSVNGSGWSATAPAFVPMAVAPRPGVSKAVPASTPKEKESPVLDAPSAAVVAALVGVGVTESVAASLVRKHGRDTVSVQLDALKHRNPKDAAAVVVASIKHGWRLPVVVTESVTRQQSKEKKQQQDALRAALERKRVETAAAGVAAFSGQSDAICGYWRELAAGKLRQELGAFSHMAQNRSVWAGMVERQAVALWSASPG